eukprot:5836316-Prymnesium_polylepis.2
MSTRMRPSFPLATYTPPPSPPCMARPVALAFVTELFSIATIPPCTNKPPPASCAPRISGDTAQPAMMTLVNARILTLSMMHPPNAKTDDDAVQSKIALLCTAKYAARPTSSPPPCACFSAPIAVQRDILVRLIKTWLCSARIPPPFRAEQSSIVESSIISRVVKPRTCQWSTKVSAKPCVWACQWSTEVSAVHCEWGCSGAP